MKSLDTKFVTLVDLPFAQKGYSFSPNGFTQILDTLNFTNGNYKYSLKVGKDVREYKDATDASLPSAKMSTSYADITSDIGSYGLAGFLIYKSYQQKASVGHYIGFGLLGYIGGGIVGRIIGNMLSKKYESK